MFSQRRLVRNFVYYEGIKRELNRILLSVGVMKFDPDRIHTWFRNHKKSKLQGGVMVYLLTPWSQYLFLYSSQRLNRFNNRAIKTTIALRADTSSRHQDKRSPKSVQTQTEKKRKRSPRQTENRRNRSPSRTDFVPRAGNRSRCKEHIPRNGSDPASGQPSGFYYEPRHVRAYLSTYETHLA
jgi:hypothetical protein